MYSMNEEMLRLLLAESMPAFQATQAATQNLGFGFLYYGLVRTIRPRHVVVIGSKKGFSVICMALGLKDNEGHGIASIACYETTMRGASSGHLHFVDPSYSVERGDENHMYGIGSWDDAATVSAWWARFGVAERVTHHKCRSDQFFAGESCPSQVDLVLADGDHTPQGVRRDVEMAMERLSPHGLILVHDVHPQCRLRGGDGLDGLDPGRFETLRLPIYPGLALIQRRDALRPHPAHDPLIDPR
jgi:predicted O-methyltransferase YrrM